MELSDDGFIMIAHTHDVKRVSSKQTRGLERGVQYSFLLNVNKGGDGFSSTTHVSALSTMTFRQKRIFTSP